MAEIFVSYTGSDRDWAFWLGKELEALGHVPYVHEWEIGAGADIYAWMQSRHEAADHVLCVLSDAYMAAPYSTLERNAALWQAASNRPGFVLLVAVAPCKLPSLSDHIRRCELFGVSQDEARRRFHAFMDKRASPVTWAFPGQMFAVSNIPIRVPEHFLGREDALAAIATSLQRYEGRVAITALHGLRGVGKTTLAAAFAERHRTDYRATWWLRAQTEAGLRADLVGLGVRLGWVAADEKEEPGLAAVMERLRHEGAGILLIYDNAIEAGALRPYLPKGGAAQALITSNAHAWRGLAAPVEIRLWPREIGADYLVARTGREAERAAAEVLSEALGGLPLAHEQAAAYCERLEITFAEYKRRFDAAPVKLLDADKDAPAEYHDSLTVAKTFALAIEKAARMHPAAEALIVHAALLAPEPIPLFFFREGREKLGEPLASALAEDGLDEVLAALRTFALIDRETVLDERDTEITTDCLRLHRLVQQVAAGRCDLEMRAERLSILVRAMRLVYPAAVFDDPAIWPRARRLDTLALALGDDAGNGIGDHGADAAYLLDKLALYRHSALAAYAQARPLTEQALAIREQTLGSEHADTTASLNNLALLLQDQGDLCEARPLFERVLAIRERVLGPEHPDTALSLNNLASLLQAQGDLSGARPFQERALAIRERVLGSEHPSTALSLNNLAYLLQAQGDLSGARPLQERALAIRERVLGPEHPYTASSLNNLALLLQAQGELSGARPLQKRALAIREQVFGPDHPSTARSLNNLACLLQAQGDLSEARPLQERALAISERVLGPEHPDTALSLNNLAYLLQAQGDLSEARPLFERALAIRERVLGPEHPDTALSSNNLARLLQDQGDLSGARPLYEQALAIRERVLGPEHPHTVLSLNNLAYLLQAQGDLSEARPLYEQALAISERVLGFGHSDTAIGYSNLAHLLTSIGQTAEAEPLFLKAIEAGKQALNPDHPLLHRFCSRYACLQLAMDRPAEAIVLAEAALAVHELARGPNHKWTKDSARVTTEALMALNRAQEAATLRERYDLGETAGAV